MRSTALVTALIVLMSSAVAKSQDSLACGPDTGDLYSDTCGCDYGYDVNGGCLPPPDGGGGGSCSNATGVGLISYSDVTTYNDGSFEAWNVSTTSTGLSNEGGLISDVVLTLPDGTILPEALVETFTDPSAMASVFVSSQQFSDTTDLGSGSVAFWNEFTDVCGMTSFASLHIGLAISTATYSHQGVAPNGFCAYVEACPANTYNTCNAPPGYAVPQDNLAPIPCKNYFNVYWLKVTVRTTTKCEPIPVGKQMDSWGTCS